jgi:hypothetical protein
MRRALLIPAFVLLASACSDDVFGPGRGFEGSYSYDGTVNGRPGHFIEGDFRITRVRGNTAEVTIDWEYFDQGFSVVRIQSDVPAIADIDSFGNIRFDFEGDLFIEGRRVFFRLEHDGQLNNNSTIFGTWRLETELPTTDRGSFTARR